MMEEIRSLLLDVRNELSEVKKQTNKIESEFNKQNEKINSLEETIKAFSSESNRTVPGATHFRKENLFNQLKEGMVNSDFKDIGGGKRSRSAVKKSASFQGKPREKMKRVKRSPHTVPSDKVEQKRLNSFRRECLSKAIQWNLVDLVKASSEKQQIVFPKWLSQEEADMIMLGTERKNFVKRFLCILMSKDFTTMQEWLQTCGFDVAVLKQVWELFEEFSNVNRFEMKCLHCRLIENVDVLDAIDYLFSADIIQVETYLRFSGSQLPVGAQDGPWKRILQECERYVCRDMVVSALKIAMTDEQRSETEKDKPVYESLVRDIEASNAEDLFMCGCSERCSKLFHPVSCLRAKSMAGVYLSPPSHRKREKSTSSEDPESSLSSFGSAETICTSASEETKKQKEYLSSLDEEAALKKCVETESEVENCKKSDEKSGISKFLFPTQSSRTRSVRRMKSKQTETSRLYESSSESIDGEKRSAVQVKTNVRSLTASQRLENKPNVIKAQNVVLNTGPQYHLKGPINRYSSEGSS